MQFPNPFRRFVKLSDPRGQVINGRDTWANKPVTVDSALNLSTVWSCIRLLAETVGTLPLSVYREDKNGEKQQDKSHYLYPLLHDAPNYDHTSCEFMEGVVFDLCGWGYHLSERTESQGKLRALTALCPENVTARRLDDGSLQFTYWDRGKQETLPEEKVFLVRGFGRGGDLGMSPIAYGRQSISYASATSEAAAKSFGVGMRPSGILFTKRVLTADQRTQVQKNLVEPFVGSDKAGGVLTLEADMDFKPVSINPVDAQLLETQAFQVEDICRWFRVPPFMIGHTEKSTSWGTGLEQQNIGFLTYALRPYLTRIEQAIRRQLILPAERKGVSAEFILEGLLRADSQGRSELYSSASQNGWMTRNEIRRKENMPPMDGGDVLTVQSNLVPLGQLGEAAPADQQARAAFRTWLGIPEEKKEGKTDEAA